MGGHITNDVLVDVDDYPEWARPWLLVLANKNFLVATGVMFVIFLPNIIWGGSSSKSSRSSAQRKAAVGKDS